RLESVARARPAIIWDVVELSAGDMAKAHGLIHGKGILLSTTERDILLAGSPNLSRPALFQTAAQANVEVAVLTEGKGIRDALFGEGGPVILGGPVSPSSVSWRPDTRSSEQATGSRGPLLLGVV